METKVGTSSWRVGDNLQVSEVKSEQDIAWSGGSRGEVISEGSRVGGDIISKAVEGNRPTGGVGFSASWEEVLAWAGWHAWSRNALRSVEALWELARWVRVVVHWDPNVDGLSRRVTAIIGNSGSQVEDTTVWL